MPSRDAYASLVTCGLSLGSCRYNRYDSIESNDDLELLFEILCRYRDRLGNHPAFTPLALVANPDFARIEADRYERYHCEPFTETLKGYPVHDRVYDLWKEGIGNRLFVPEFHGREHLNVRRWIEDLRKGVAATRRAFQVGVTGIGMDQAEGLSGDYQAAFDLDQPEDWTMHEEIVRDGLGLFRKLFGYEASFFTPPNGLYSHKLDETLKVRGIEFINAGRCDVEPRGRGRTRWRFRYMGQRNKKGQRYLIRTAQFEPSEECGVDWVDRCLAGMAIAFRWGKPAIISSHRVNFCGYLVPDNRSRGLRELDRLLAQILTHWPDAEFLTMRELRALMAGTVQV